MNLGEFMECGARNGYIDEEGFETLYVRRSCRSLPNLNPADWHDKTIKYNAFDISKVEAIEKGKGTFKRFVSRIRRDYPALAIYVECVLTDRFKEGLIRMGFTLCAGVDSCFLLPPEHPLILEDL